MYMLLKELLPQQSSLTIQRIENREKLKDFAAIFVELSRYESIYKEYYELVPPILYQKGAPFEMYVGYEGAAAVTAGLLILHANVAGIYYIMTRPSHRRKGYGTAMMYHLLNRA